MCGCQAWHGDAKSKPTSSDGVNPAFRTARTRAFIFVQRLYGITVSGKSSSPSELDISISVGVHGGRLSTIPVGGTGESSRRRLSGVLTAEEEVCKSAAALQQVCKGGGGEAKEGSRHKSSSSVVVGATEAVLLEASTLVRFVL